ncbi:MAG: Asp23/Gls24 family envelope stress response protein [Clostridiales Family XIII bacterium]|jgi:uncharacterized alkaline shock family protein YloU|nr:Asp23/Gls24 family envelope stress response protein [Clostridiales Family XIII bacterium]
MKIYSFVGKSGTGKSFQAADLASEHNIESIIDDGLFIVKGSILAGISAKRQHTKIKAIKTALFTDEAHRAQVEEAIRSAGPASILVIGTSDKMIGIITEHLGLPEPSVKFRIEDLTTEDERELAHKHRSEYGQHVIPAPTFQIKKDFSGYFIHPLRSIKDITQDIKGGIRSAASASAAAERSIVRPTFSYLGSYSISDLALSDIARIAAGEVDGVDSVHDIYVKKQDDSASVEMGAVIRYGMPVLDIARHLQTRVTAKVEEITSINVLAVDVEIQGLLWLNNK